DVCRLKMTPVAAPSRVPFYLSAALLFLVSLAVTFYFCRSMAGEMSMPGGWSMSMAWMRMPGQSWPMAGVMFMAMWLAMMVAMMLPSALPMIRLSRHAARAVSGYFLVWLLVGAPVYIAGAAVSAAAMRWPSFSRWMPVLAALALAAAGLIQFMPWK